MIMTAQPDTQTTDTLTPGEFRGKCVSTRGANGFDHPNMGSRGFNAYNARDWEAHFAQYHQYGLPGTWVQQTRADAQVQTNQRIRDDHQQSRWIGAWVETPDAGLGQVWSLADSYETVWVAVLCPVTDYDGGTWHRHEQDGNARRTIHQDQSFDSRKPHNRLQRYDMSDLTILRDVQDELPL